MSIRLLDCIQYLIQGPAHGRHSIISCWTNEWILWNRTKMNGYSLDCCSPKGANPPEPRRPKLRWEKERERTWLRWVQPSLLSFSLHASSPGLQNLLHLDPSAQISFVHTLPALHALHPYIKASITLLSHRCLWIQMCSVCSPVLWASSYADLP